MRKAQVIEATGEVENIVVLPDDPDPKAKPYAPPDGRILVDDDGTAAKGGSWDGAAFQPPPPPFTLDELKAAAVAEVDAQAEAARYRYITPGAGQAMTYDAKGKETERWAADGAPDPANYPWARARAARLNGVTPPEVTVAQAQAVIDEWAAVIAAWEAAGIAIEDVREQAKEDIEAAADRAAVDAALAGLAWPAPA